MPPRDVDRLQSEIAELFADLWHLPRFAAPQASFRPHVDCFRTKDPPTIHVVVELAGVDPDAVSIVLDGRALLVSGVRERRVADGEPTYHQMEIDYGHFECRVRLEEDVRGDRAQASYERGMLRITIPVAASVRAGAKVAIEVRRE
jgi:HSP20 family protein